jgi:hypothetical protein
MRRRRAILVLGVAVLLTAGVGLAVRYRKLYAPPVLALPADDEVVEMRASFRRAPAGKAVPQFVVPADHVPLILEWLRPGEYVREPRPLDRLSTGQARTRRSSSVLPTGRTSSAGAGSMARAGRSMAASA